MMRSSLPNNSSAIGIIGLGLMAKSMAIRELLEKAVALGDGDLDNSAVIKAIRENST